MHVASNNKILYEKYDRKRKKFFCFFFVPQQTDINVHEHYKKQINKQN